MTQIQNLKDKFDPYMHVLVLSAIIKCPTFAQTTDADDHFSDS